MANRSRMMFPDSGLVVGPSHSDGGVYASVANGPDVELEGGEFIINKEATEDFLPLIKQINDIGRMEQMNNADNAQNAHSAIDALIASASTKMMPGGGMVAPKTPMYQEGGQTSPTLMDYINQIESNLLKYQGDVKTKEGKPRFTPSGDITKEALAEDYNFPLQDATFDTLASSANLQNILINLPNDRTISLLKSPFGMTDKESERDSRADVIEENIRKNFPEEYNALGFDTFRGDASRAKELVNAGFLNMDPLERMRFSREEKLKQRKPKETGESEAMKKRMMEVLGMTEEEYDKFQAFKKRRGINREQGGMIQYEEGGPLHSRRMFNQGTGFDKKKSDLNKDGKISEYEKKRGMAIAKSMKNQMQMGGMVGMQQPMMQRPMNPAMNLSPMQRMGNNMPPMMYQEGGSILPSQNTLRGIRRDAMSVLDNVGIENLRQAAMDTLMKMDMRPQEERSLFGSGQPVGMRVPETYGPPAPRKQKEMRQKNSDLDELLKGLVIEVNPFTGDTITEQSIKEELERIRRRVEQSKKPNMQEGGMISDSNLMGAMANDRRVAALQPDVYSSRMQNGMTGAEAMVVPKLAEAILPAYGIETPLSRKQGAMLNKNAVSPSALNPNLKGLVNRLLVQRLANETT
jgi:hypothetical protein